jgi:hypothetical protein
LPRVVDWVAAHLEPLVDFVEGLEDHLLLQQLGWLCKLYPLVKVEPLSCFRVPDLLGDGAA